MKLLLSVIALTLLISATISKPLSIVILGASGDLAKRKVFPSLLYMYKTNVLPTEFNVVGYARSNLTVADLKKNIEPFISKEDLSSPFFDHLQYVKGSYDKPADFDKLGEELNELEKGSSTDRIFYFSLPSTTFVDVANNLNSKCRTSTGYNRIVVEKPFGKNSKTFEELSAGLNKNFKQDKIYRMDHFLGSSIVGSILSARLKERADWNNRFIKSIQVIFKETLDVEGRGGYFDEYGIIRDMVQSHLMQISTLLTMDEPNSEADIVNKKIQVLEHWQPLQWNDLVLGQYKGYPEDKSVHNPNTTTETFASMAFHINNERWNGVPLLIKVGKGLDKFLFEIVVEYKNGANLRLQAGDDSLQYAKLLTQLLKGDQSSFATEKEIAYSWASINTVLAVIDSHKVKPIVYPLASEGPSESDDLAKKYGTKWADKNETKASSLFSRSSRK